MVGRHVDEAGAGVGGDMVAGQEGAGLGEEAAEMVHRVAGDGAGELARRRHACHVSHRLNVAVRAADRFVAIGCDEHRVRHEQRLRPCRSRRRSYIDVRPVGDRLVDRDRPRRRRPDHRMSADQLRDRALDDLERHVDLGRDDVLIFDLGLGQRGLLDRATTSPAWRRGRAGRSRRTSAAPRRSSPRPRTSW